MSKNRNYSQYFKKEQSDEPERREEEISTEPEPESDGSEQVSEVAAEPESPKVTSRYPYKAKVVGAKKVNLRVDAHLKAYIIKVLEKGTIVEVTDKSPNKIWCQVRYNEHIGYMMSQYLKKEIS